MNSYGGNPKKWQFQDGPAKLSFFEQKYHFGIKATINPNEELYKTHIIQTAKQLKLCLAKMPRNASFG